MAKVDEEISSKLGKVKIHFEWTETVEWHRELLNRIKQKNRKRTLAVKAEIAKILSELRLVPKKG